MVQIYCFWGCFDGLLTFFNLRKLGYFNNKCIHFRHFWKWQVETLLFWHFCALLQCLISLSTVDPALAIAGFLCVWLGLVYKIQIWYSRCWMSSLRLHRRRHVVLTSQLCWWCMHACSSLSRRTLRCLGWWHVWVWQSSEWCGLLRLCKVSGVQVRQSTTALVSALTATMNTVVPDGLYWTTLRSTTLR